MAFAKRLGVTGEKARFSAVDGMHEASMDENGIVSLKMADVKEISTINNDSFLHTGSPHYVKEVNDLAHYDVKSEGKKIRNSEMFRETGTNVNFIENTGDGLFVRTYERGVEDETLSCGTGVTAAALVAVVRGLCPDKNFCHIHTPGGRLTVTFEKVLEHNFYNIWLHGPAVMVYEGTILI